MIERKCQTECFIKTCRSCDAKIVWGRTANNRKVPLNYPPERRFVFVPGSDRVTFLDSYTSHFASCPYAAKHRKKEAK
jgi:hypothetical protein